MRDYFGEAVCVLFGALCVLLLVALLIGGVSSARNGTPVPTPCPATLPMPGNPAILLPVCNSGKVTK